MPAIVVGNHSDGAVTELCFSGQFGLRNVGHANYIKVHRAVHVRFRKSGKLRTFHADVGSAPMSLDAAVHAGVCQNARNLRASRLIERNVRHQAVAKKRRDSTFGTVDELIRYQKLSGSKILLERPYRTYR